MRALLINQICILFAMSLLAGAAAAADRPNVEYAADQLMETANTAMKAHLYVTPTMERRDMNTGGQKMILITRHDKKVVWNVMPDEGMYMEMKLTDQPPAKDDLSAYKIEQTEVGQETLNGVNVTKAKIVMTHADGGKLGGFMWTTREGIMVKMDALSIEKGNKDRIKMELTNLQIGKQPASLFDIPAGVQKMDMPGMDMDAIQKMMK